MRITHYLQKILLERGGVVRAVLDMATVTAARGHEVTVVTHDGTDTPAEWKAGGAVPRVVEIGPHGGMQKLTAPQVSRFREVLGETDVLHIHACWNPANNTLARLADALGVPYVQSVHGMLDDWSMAQSTLKKKVFLAMGGRKTLRGARLVHCTAEAELSQARKWFAPAEGVSVPLVFDLAPFRDLPGPGPAREAFGDAALGDGPSVLFLSRVHYKKGPDVFVRTIAALKARGTDCVGLIAGTGDEGYVEEIRGLARELGVEDRVRFLGMVTGVEKVSLYETADVFCLPTSQENFGFVFPEALACGTPVVTTTGVDTHPELSASGGAVILDSRDPEQFAGALEPLLADADRRRAMGEAGRRWVFEALDPDTVAARFKAMYERAVEKS